MDMSSRPVPTNDTKPLFANEQTRKAIKRKKTFLLKKVLPFSINFIRQKKR